MNKSALSLSFFIRIFFHHASILKQKILISSKITAPYPEEEDRLLGLRELSELFGLQRDSYSIDCG